MPDLAVDGREYITADATDTMSDAQQATEPLLPHATSARKSKKVVVFVVCAVLLLAVDFGFYMSNAPQLAVFEDIICRNYKETLHRTGDALTPSLVEGNPCKSEAVQGELALVIGYKDTFDVLPGMSSNRGFDGC